MEDNNNLVLKILKQNKWIFASVITSWIIFSFIILGLIKITGTNIGNLGLFGDSFNVLTSLFTGLAFSGVIVSIILQTEELKAVRSEMEGQKKALEEQQKEMKIQSFNNKFFQMLNLFSNIVDNLSIPFTTPVSVGNKTKKDVLKHIKEEKLLAIKVYLQKDTDSNYKYEYYLNKDNYMVRFKEVNDDFDNTFKYYFINLYQVLNYTDKSHTDTDDAKQYTNIIRAQLSKDELVLLFYNAIGVKKFSEDKYKNLVETYSFFEHLQYKDLCHHEMIETANHIFKDSIKNQKIDESDGHFSLINSLIKTYGEKAFGENKTMLKFKKIVDKDKNIKSFTS